jgi:hypothetical protein
MRASAEMLVETYPTFPSRQCSSRMEKMQHFGRAADRACDVCEARKRRGV